MCFILIILSFFLLLKSRAPYENKCYLMSLKGLKVSIFIISWLAMTGIAIYFGYTFTFFLNLGVSGCTTNDLRSYATGYWTNVVMSGVMTLMALLTFLLSIGIRKEPTHMKDKLFKP